MRDPWFSIVDVVDLHGRSMADIAREICLEAGVTIADFKGRSLRRDAVKARRDFVRTVVAERPDLSTNQVARFIGRDASNVRARMGAERGEGRAYTKLRQFEAVGLDVLRRWGMPGWARDIVKAVAFDHQIYVTEITSDNRRKPVVAARNEAMYLIKAGKPMLSSEQIARWFGCHHTSILHSIASHQELTGAPKLVGYNLNRDRKRKAALDRHNRLRQEAA